MFEFIEEILVQFRDVPGLNFLKRVHTRLLMTQSSYLRKRDRVRSLHGTMKNAAKSAKDLGTKGRAGKRRSDQ